MVCQQTATRTAYTCTFICRQNSTHPGKIPPESTTSEALRMKDTPHIRHSTADHTDNRHITVSHEKDRIITIPATKLPHTIHTPHMLHSSEDIRLPHSLKRSSTSPPSSRIQDRSTTKAPATLSGDDTDGLHAQRRGAELAAPLVVMEGADGLESPAHEQLANGFIQVPRASMMQNHETERSGLT